MPHVFHANSNQRIAEATIAIDFLASSHPIWIPFWAGFVFFPGCIRSILFRKSNKAHLMFLRASRRIGSDTWTALKRVHGTS
jgi:hypothetical protein